MYLDPRPRRGNRDQRRNQFEPVVKELVAGNEFEFAERLNDPLARAYVQRAASEHRDRSGDGTSAVQREVLPGSQDNDRSVKPFTLNKKKR